MSTVQCLMYFDKNISESYYAYGVEIERLIHGIKDKLFFQQNGNIEDEHLDELKNKYLNKYELLPINDFFKIANNIRKNDKYIKDDIYVILITNKGCNENLISANDGKNIYINLNELMKYSDDKSMYPLAYQILENLFQALNKIKYTIDIFNDNRLHTTPVGCINDLCKFKEDIVLKLNNASICKKCLALAKKNKISNDIIDSFKFLLKHLRKHNEHFKNTFYAKNTLLCISATGEITLKDKLIKLESKPKAYFIYFLLNPEEHTLDDLKNKTIEIAKIYNVLKSKGQKKLSDMPNIKYIESIKDSFIEYNKTCKFRNYKSNIRIAFEKMIIDKIITEEESNQFFIQEKKLNTFNIKLKEELFSIHENFKVK